MATETATIRVTRATRDLLAKQAHARGTSLAALLAEVAHEQEAQLIWNSERVASRLDAENSFTTDEDRAWEVALADGVD
jgi:uncharacterized protein (DUF1778 family)